MTDKDSNDDTNARAEAAFQHYLRTNESYNIEDVLNELRELTAARRKELER